jgi:hypothetical protein
MNILQYLVKLPEEKEGKFESSAGDSLMAKKQKGIAGCPQNCSASLERCFLSKLVIFDLWI